MAIRKKIITWDKNVGGVNFGKCENIVDTLELADVNNLIISPIGGYRKRGGCLRWITHTAPIIGLKRFVNNFGNSFLLGYDEDGYLYKQSNNAWVVVTEPEVLS